MGLGDLAEHADLVSLSAHKMYGPQGIGVLYIRRALQGRVEPLIHGGGQQNGLRSGTLPLPLCVGMGAAAGLLGEPEATQERDRVARKRDRFVDLLCGAGWPVSVNGPGAGMRHPGNANLSFGDLDAHDILGALQPRLAASTGAACTSGIPEASHVLAALGHSAAASDTSIRVSFGRFTTDDEVEKAADLVVRAAASLAPSRSAGVTASV